MAVASSKGLYNTRKSLLIPSFTEAPRGWDTSKMSLRDPSFFGLDPNGEQWISGNGGETKGPDK